MIPAALSSMETAALAPPMSVRTQPGCSEIMVILRPRISPHNPVVSEFSAALLAR
jgi:hypothetical protein